MAVGHLLLPGGPGQSSWIKSREEPAATSRQAGRRLGREGISSVFVAKDSSYEIQGSRKVEARRSEAVTKARQPHQALRIGRLRNGSLVAAY